MTSQASAVSSRSSATSPQGRALGWLLATDGGAAATALRLTLAIVMFPHGAQKALGMFGGHGWSGTMGFLTGTVGLPSFVAAGVILLEFLGPILLLIGLGTRAVALGFAGLMLGAIATVHGSYGFFMNWFGGQAGEGFEYHLLVIGIALALVFAGGGRWSLDARLAERR
ncbi:MAG: DoxX family protein [Planctomycetes bacterium]|nr:DoxX family protein [Planctomycetota bacterium]